MSLLSVVDANQIALQFPPSCSNETARWNFVYSDVSICTSLFVHFLNNKYKNSNNKMTSDIWKVYSHLKLVTAEQSFFSILLVAPDIESASGSNVRVSFAKPVCEMSLYIDCRIL